jgi:subtilisin family serine protease
MSDRAAARASFLPRVVVAVAAVLATATIPTVATAFSPGAGAQADASSATSWVVRYKPGFARTAAASLASASVGRGPKELRHIGELNADVVTLPKGHEKAALAKLKRNPSVASVEPDGTMTATVTPHDPHWTQAWGPRLVHAPAAWSMTTGKASTIIAVVDTGVDPRQPDLRGRVLRGYDFVGNDANARDDNGHGTAVAGVAAAAANNGVGIAGMCWQCRILPVKVLNARGSGTHSDIAAGIVWATRHGADVINLSLAGPSDANVIHDAVNFALRRGVVVVAAAGNEGSHRKFYPAAYPGVISVGATNNADRLYAWSNKGTWVKVTAPGCAYTGSTGPVRWSWWCGTSFATPVIAGTAALVKSLTPSLSRSTIERTVLRSTVRIRGVALGRIDALSALRTAQNIVAGKTNSGAPEP